MDKDEDIVQQFRATKPYWWMRNAVERIAVWLLDATIYIFCYLIGIFLMVYINLGFKVAIILLLWIGSMVTGWHASDWHIVERWMNAGLFGKLVFIFYFVSPLFSAVMIWGMFHEHD